jgi:hypothetical protein
MCDSRCDLIDLQLPPKVRHAQAYGDVFAVGGVVSRVES